MPISSDDPAIRPWKAREPVDHRRLNAIQERAVMEVHAGPGLMAFRKGNSVTLSVARSRPQRPPGFFPVKVEKTGGADGSLGGAATWTYTIRRMDWTGSGTSADFELATVKSPQKRRPNGKASFPTGSTTVGSAYYDSTGTIQLWDANEVYGTGSC